MASSSSLSDFPPELLLSTFEYFCPHCHDETEHPIYRQLTLKGKAALLSLCLVSKQLSAVATTILYHDPCAVDLYDDPCAIDVNKTCHLLSNFLSKPHLADNIRTLRLEPTHWYAERNLGQQRMLNALLDRLDLDPWDPYSAKDGNADDNGEEASKTADDDKTTPELDDEALAADEEVMEKLYRPLIRELLTRARNLNELSITNEGWTEETGNEETDNEETTTYRRRMWTRRPTRRRPTTETDTYEENAWQCLAANPRALAGLRRLEVITCDPKRGFNGTNQGGFWLNDTQLWLACSVMEAARKLERLSVRVCRGVSFAGTIPSVTSVELLTSNLTNKDLQKLVACFPALREFRYESGGRRCSGNDKEHRPADIARYLRPLRLSLTSVSLDYRLSAMWSLRTRMMNSFRGFPVLESMELHKCEIFDQSVSQPPVDRLVSLLPPSLKRLTISGDTPARECHSLVRAVQVGQFPALEEVNFGHVLGPPKESQDEEYQDRDASTTTDMEFWIPIRDDLEALNIKCSVGPDYSSDRFGFGSVPDAS